jgi:16S rRNA (guanine(966)-N(2))-methyltransferase RsmD
MRIIAGRFRGLRLPALRGSAVRPTAERVREAVFSMLGTEVVDARVLDLFAGSGSFGLEALSRGAVSVVFVDKDRKVTERLALTIKAFGATDGASVFTMDAFEAVRVFFREGSKFDIVFLDPPYGDRLISRVLSLREFPGLVEPEGIVVTERETRGPEERVPASFRRVSSRKYGDTLIEVFRYEESR